jgi:acyl carrier protein
VNPVSSPAGRLYKTGDRARRLSNGDIEFLGRVDRQVKIRGHRIELGEIEAALRQHPALRDCVTVAREDTPGERRLVSYIVPEPDKASLASAEWRGFLQTKLPEYMVPSAVVLLEALPLTPNGKLDRTALPVAGPVRPELKQVFVAPSTPTEETLATIWREVLQIGEVGAQDNFFELGGHSLLMTRVISRIREAFQVEVPIRSFFETPTLAGLALAVEELIVTQVSRMSDEQARRMAHSQE